MNKKSVAARAQELNYKKGDRGPTRRNVEAAREKEWSNWKSFDAVDVVLPEEAEAILKEHPEVSITPKPSKTQGTWRALWCVETWRKEPKEPARTSNVLFPDA